MVTTKQPAGGTSVDRTSLKEVRGQGDKRVQTDCKSTVIQITNFTTEVYRKAFRMHNMLNL